MSDNVISWLASKRRQWCTLHRQGLADLESVVIIALDIRACIQDLAGLRLQFSTRHLSHDNVVE